MTLQEKKQAGRNRNKKLFYKDVMTEFNKHDCNDIPITQIWRKYIFPKFFISRQTLYKIFNSEND